MRPCVTRRFLGRIALGGAAAAVAVAAPSAARAAEALPAPSGKPILTVSGKIANPNAGDAASFDRDMLERLGMEGFQTTTPWYNGPVRFEGIRMTRLLEAVGAAGTSITAIALNDYTTQIPISDFGRYGTLMALKRDGTYMPVRDKGPLFIVYPYDSAPELKAQQFYSRSAWQVAKLVVA